MVTNALDSRAATANAKAAAADVAATPVSRSLATPHSGAVVPSNEHVLPLRESFVFAARGAREFAAVVHGLGYTRTVMTTRSPSKKSSPKKSAAKPIAASKAPTFATFAPWKKVSLDGDEDGEGSRFDLLTATNDSVDYEDLFGEEPEHAMVCASSVKVDGDLSLSGWQAKKGLQQTVYVIDGDLSVDGTLVFSQSDLCTTLWVKGRVAASRVVLASSAMLICDALEVRDALVTYLEDAGHLIVHGPLVAKVWIDLAQGRGSVELDERPAARLLSDYYAAHKRDDVPRDDGDEDDERGAYLRSALEWEPATIALRTTLVSDGEADVTKVLEAAKSGAALLA